MRKINDGLRVTLPGLVVWVQTEFERSGLYEMDRALYQARLALHRVANSECVPVDCVNVARECLG